MVPVEAGIAQSSGYGGGGISDAMVRIEENRVRVQRLRSRVFGVVMHTHLGWGHALYTSNYGIFISRSIQRQP